MKQAFQILVVDDEALVRRSIKMLLEHQGHKVWLADSGETALTELIQRGFDLVITNFSMPGMRGDELRSRIRQLKPLQPIIVATAFVEECKASGPAFGNLDALLFKPFSFNELNEAIEKVLAGRQTEAPGVLPIPLPPAAPKIIPPLAP